MSHEHDNRDKGHSPHDFGYNDAKASDIAERLRIIREEAAEQYVQERREHFWMQEALEAETDYELRILKELEQVNELEQVEELEQDAPEQER